MLFNSLDFAVFFSIVFVLYWFCTAKNLKLQNLLIVVSSYVFYGWWDWRFLSLIFLSTLEDYFVALKISKTIDERKRKILLFISIAVNIGFLGFFKYYNFFIENFIAAFTLFGIKSNISSLNIILPVGISFYTFQTMSYTIDVYKKKLEPTKDFISFAAFVAFFPQLVAGPIERAANLLPQFHVKRSFDYANAVSGLRQILWGLFKKIVIADNCAVYANYVFGNHNYTGGITLFLGAVFFSFQIYGDFSGYSDIAIGTGKLLGFKLMHNFNFPYFSRDIAEFWRRWHISLTTWFRDYIYIPLGGSRVSKGKVVRNTFIIFLISGLWHGANWTFILWGIFHAVLFMPLILLGKNRNYMNTVAEGKLLPNINEIFQMGSTFLLVLIGWILFRSESIWQAIEYLREMVNKNLFNLTMLYNKRKALITTIYITIMLIVEWFGRNTQFGLDTFAKTWKKPYRWIAYLSIASLILLNIKSEEIPFIYFQF
jgi:D-alanyl-lipoteichoic acid acyltransferase DltB (MBOAT superfamily)